MCSTIFLISPIFTGLLGTVLLAISLNSVINEITKSISDVEDTSGVLRGDGIIEQITQTNKIKRAKELKQASAFVLAGLLLYSISACLQLYIIFSK